MRIDIVTIFPEYFSPLELSLLGKARERGLLNVAVHDLRQWTHDRHHTVDDTPCGGGPGMVMTPEPWGRALDTVAGAADPPPRLILPTPSGRTFTQDDAARLADEPWLVVGCGRYEGIDARVAEEAASRMPVEELSVGDYVLAGGEAAALVMIEAIGRLLPGVLGNADSAEQDSFGPTMANLLEAPVYTKPAVWRDRPVPPVLLSGNHAAIAQWRREESLRRTADRRPDLLRRTRAEELSERERQVIAEAAGSSSSGDMAD